LHSRSPPKKPDFKRELRFLDLHLQTETTNGRGSLAQLVNIIRQELPMGLPLVVAHQEFDHPQNLINHEAADGNSARELNCRLYGRCAAPDLARHARPAGGWLTGQ
jgi:hypothetical protein